VLNVGREKGALRGCKGYSLVTVKQQLSLSGLHVEPYELWMTSHTCSDVLLRPDWAAQYCHQRVCLSVCLSARISQKPRVQTLRSVLYVLTVAVAWFFSDDSATCYAFSVLWMTCFHIMAPVEQYRTWRYVSSSSPGSGTRAKSDVYDHLVVSVRSCDLVRHIPVVHFPVLHFNILFLLIQFLGR